MPPKQQQPERTVLHPTPSNPAPNLLANPAEDPNAANPAANPNAEADPNITNPNTAANPNTTNVQQTVALVTRVLSLLEAEKEFLDKRNSAMFERKAFPNSDLHKRLRTTREDLNVALDELRLLAHYQPQQLQALLDDSKQMSSNNKQIVMDALSLPYRRASPFDIVNFGRAAADEFRYETEYEKAMKATDEIQEVFLRAVKLRPETDLFPRVPPFQTTQPPRKVAEVTNAFVDGSIGYVVTTAGPQQSDDEDVVLPKSTTTATDTKEKAEHHAKPTTAANTASESAVAKPPPPSRPRRPQTQRRQPSVESIVYFFSLFNKNSSNQEEEGEDDEVTTQQQQQFQELLKRCSLTTLIISRGVAAKHRRHAADVTAVIDAEITERMKRQCINEIERGVGGDAKKEEDTMSNRYCCKASAWNELALMLRREDAMRKIQKERRETSIQQNVEDGDSLSSFVMVHGTQHDAASCDRERLNSLIALGAAARQQPTLGATKNPRMKDDGSGDDNDNEDNTPPSAAKKNDGAAAGNNKVTPANVLPNPFCKGRTNVSATALFETGQHHHAPGSAVLLEGVGGTGKTSHCEVVEYHRTIAHQRTHFIRVCSLHSGQQRRDEVYTAAMEELDAHLGEGRNRGGGGEGGVLYIVDGLDECQLVGVDPRWVLDLIHTIHQKMRKDADSLLLTTRPGGASANSELVSMFRFPFFIRHILEYDVDYVEEVMAHRPLGVQLKRSSPVLRNAFTRLLRNPLVMSQCYHFEEPADDEHGSYANSIMRHTSFQLVDALVHRWIAHDLAKVGSYLSTESVVAAATETLWHNRDRTAAMQRHQHGDWIEQRDDLAFRRGNTACVRSFGLRPHTGTSYEEEVYYAFLLFIGATLNETPCGTMAYNYSHTARWLTQPDIEPLLRNVMRPFRPCDLRYRSGEDGGEVSLAQSAHGYNVACVQEYQTRLYENPTAVGVFLHFRNGSGYHDSEAQHDCIATYASIMKHQQQQGGAVLTHVVNVRGICQINDIQHWLFHERTRSITRDDKALSVLWADEEYQPSSTGVLSALLLLRDMAKALEQLLSCGLVYREPAELSINHFAFVKPTTAEAPVVKFAAVYRLKFEDDPVCVQRQDAAAQTAAQFLRECFWPSIIREGNRRTGKPLSSALEAVDDEISAVNLLRRAGLGKDLPKDAAELLVNNATQSIASIVEAIAALIRTTPANGGSSSPNSPK